MPVGGTLLNQSVTVVVDGQNLGVFDTFTGGDAVSKVTKHRPGGMGPERAYPGLPSFSDLTVTRVNEFDRDWEIIRSLRPKAGRVLGSVTVQPLDSDGNAYGNSQTYSGRFVGVKGLKGDSKSEAESMYDLDFAIEAVA